MPTYQYTIDNKVYTSQEPLTDAELTELSGGEEPSRIAEAARKGVSGFVGLASGFAGGLSALARGRPDQMIDRAKRGYTSVQEGMMEILGSTGVKPRTRMEQIGMAAVEGAVDPLTYLLPGSSAVRAMTPWAKRAYQVGEGMIAGAASEGGGIVGEIAGEKAGGETGAQVGRVVGALAGGVGSVTALGQAPRALKIATPAVSKVKNLLAKARGTGPMDEAERMAQGHIDKIFSSAAAADPNFAEVLDAALRAQEKTGVKLPVSALLKDNPTLNGYIGHLARTDLDFRKAYFEQFEEAKKGLGVAANKLFGDPVGADKALTGSVTGKGKDWRLAGKKVQERSDTLAGRALAQSQRVKEVEPGAFGAKIAKVTEAAEDAARAKTTPSYTKAFDIAKAKGVELPKEAVEDIYNTVVDGRNADIFASMPSIYNKVKAVFKPRVTKGANLVDVRGKPLGGQTEAAFSKASVEDLDSLKREINLQLRTAKTDSRISVLEDLKAKVSQHTDALDSDFVTAYRKADRDYLENVGLPFNAETIRSVERAKFNENIVPLLTKYKSTTRQFLDATGEDGKKLVEDAFASSLAKAAVGADGTLNPNRAKAWLSLHREQLALVPETRKTLEELSHNVGALLSRRDALEASFDNAAKARILKTEAVDAQGLVTKMYGSGDFTGRFLQQYGNDKDAMKAVRSFMLDDILKSGKPLEMLDDRTRKNVYDAVFGPRHSRAVRDLALVSDRLTKDPSAVATDLSKLDADLLTQMVGMKPERLLSLFLTNPVVSKPVAVMTVLNRFFNKQAGEIVERDMKKLLLDREGGARMFSALKPGKKGGIDAAKVGEFADWAKAHGFNFVDMLKADAKAGALRSYRGMNEEELQQP